MLSDAVMIELASDDHLCDQSGQLKTKFKAINFACEVHVKQVNGREFLLAEVPDASKDAVDLVTEKLNELGLHAMCFPWDIIHAYSLGRKVEI